MRKAPRYQSGNKKRYACPTCNRRFAAWSSIFQHSVGMHGIVPTVLRCDLVLRAERRRLAAEGVPEEDLPVIMAGEGYGILKGAEVSP